MEEVNENDEDYYKLERVRNAFINDSGDYNYIVYESRGSKYCNSLEEYLSKIKPYIENMIANYISIGEWKLQLTVSIERVELLKYKLHKISLRRGGAYIDSPKWIKNKKTTINPKNTDNGCFANALIAALNHHKIDNHPERVSKLGPYIHDYNWQGVYFPENQRTGKS